MSKEIRLRLMKSAYKSDLAEYREKGYISGIGWRHLKSHFINKFL